MRAIMLTIVCSAVVLRAVELGGDGVEWAASEGGRWGGGGVFVES
jgi:hypothetical protein